MINHLDDLEADFLRFFQVDDIYRLGGARFMRLAWRVSAYGGVMHMRLQDQERPATGPTPSAPVQRQPRDRAAAPTGDAKVVPLAAFRSAFPGSVEHRRRGRS